MVCRRVWLPSASPHRYSRAKTTYLWCKGGRSAKHHAKHTRAAARSRVSKRTRCASRWPENEENFCRDPKFIINLAGETPAVEALTMANTISVYTIYSGPTGHTSDANTTSLIIRHDRTDERGHRANALAQRTAAARAYSRDQHVAQPVSMRPRRHVSALDSSPHSPATVTVLIPHHSQCAMRWDAQC